MILFRQDKMPFGMSSEAANLTMLRYNYHLFDNLDGDEFAGPFMDSREVETGAIESLSKS
jgi:hypothetical protein